MRMPPIASSQQTIAVHLFSLFPLFPPVQLSFLLPSRALASQRLCVETGTRWTDRVKRLLSDYGSLLVLLLLCAYYSAVTWTEQQPVTPAAGRDLAAAIIDEHGDSAAVVIVVRNTRLDAAFARAIAEELEASGATVLETVAAATPVDARRGSSALRANTPASMPSPPTTPARNGGRCSPPACRALPPNMRPWRRLGSTSQPPTTGPHSSPAKTCSTSSTRTPTSPSSPSA